MSDAVALRKIANDLRAEADRRDVVRRVQSTRVVVAAVGIEALRKLAGGRP
jgi:hypothetical protein